MARQRASAMPGTRILGDDGHTGHGGNRLPWRGTVIALAIFVVLLAAALLVSHTSSGNSTSPTGNDQLGSRGGAQDPASNETNTRGSVDGVPVGYAHTQAGAAQAAVNYEIARSSPGYLTDAGERATILRAITASSALQSQVANDNDAAAQLLKSLGLTSATPDDLVARAAALGTHITSYSPQECTVDVWMTGILGTTAPQSPVPVSASWATYSMTLTWEKGDWKLSSVSSVAGPTPLQTTDNAPSSVQDFEHADHDFDRPPYAR